MQQIFDPRISVLFRESLKDLSPKLILVAEVDILHDEQILYHKRLLEEGVQSDLKIYKGAFHAFFRLVIIYSRKKKKFIGVISSRQTLK